MARTAEDMVCLLVEPDLDTEEGSQATDADGCPRWLVRQLVEQAVLGTPCTRNVPGHVLDEFAVFEDYVGDIMADLAPILVPEPLGYQVWLQEDPNRVELLLSVPSPWEG